MEIINRQLSVLIMPTEQCNMNCIYCFNGERKKNHSKMSIDTYKRFLDITTPYVDQLTIIWHGGEPITMGLDFYKQAIEIQKEYPKTTIKNRMQSNLSLLTDEWVEFLKENNISVGSSHDGGCNEETRGNSEKVISNVLKLKEKEMSHGVISVISNKNIDTMISDYLYFKGIGISYTPNLYVANAEDTDDSLTLDPAHAIKKFCELYDFWIHDLDTETHIRFFELYIDYVLRRTHNLCSLSSCLGHWMGLKYDGEIVPCNRSFPDEFSYGNIYNYDSIEQAFDSEGFRNILYLSIQRREKCKDCIAYDMCVGGCNNVAYNQGGIDKNNGNHCLIFKGVYSYVVDHITKTLESGNYSNINPLIRKELEIYDKESKKDTQAKE